MGDFYVVKSGLQEGEEIATNGVFRIDAAAQLAGKPSMMNPEGTKVSTGHNHGGGGTGNGDEHDDTPKKKTSKKFKVSSEFKAQLSEVLSSYLVLKDALVADDEKGAKNEAKNMKKAIKNTDMALLKGDAHMVWMSDMKSMNANLDALIAGENLEKTRIAFRGVSNQITEIIDRFELAKTDGLYMQYCPMADAFWISAEDAIRNPYYGSGMLKCGEVVRVF